MEYFRCIVYLSLLAALVSGASSYQFNSRPADVAVSSDGKVYVVADKSLYSLHTNLSLEQSVTLTTRDTVANKVALSSDDNLLVVCFKDGTCFIYSVDDNRLNFLYRVNAAVPNANVAVTPGGIIPGHFYFGSSGVRRLGANSIILLRAYDFLWAEEVLIRSSQNFVINNSTFVGREFYYAFQYTSYIYYIVMDAATNLSSSGIKVLRVCEDANDTSFSAMFEVELRCSTGENTLVANSINVVESKEPKIVIGLEYDSSYEICSFYISDIDSAMDRVFQECADGTHRIALPWADYSLLADCFWFNEVSNISQLGQVNIMAMELLCIKLYDCVRG